MCDRRAPVELAGRYWMGPSSCRLLWQAMSLVCVAETISLRSAVAAVSNYALWSEDYNIELLTKANCNFCVELTVIA